MNNLITYGQTFSKGQLTISKKIRDYYGLGENFAYKMYNHDKKIIIEPQEKVKKNMSQKEFVEFLTNMDTGWYTDNDYKNYLAMRKQNDERPSW